ncbi:lysyl oxidase homolog 2-like [Lineus longissimus]|uniref:lysyl oxidase homolog 2-like n=1 Tax=Lineus longissimus TaxID=88925 RepID=UPI002B4E2454
MKGRKDTAMSYGVLVLLAAAFVADGIIELGQGNYEGQVMLIGGKDDSEGNVVIYHLSQWGNICDDYWNIWAGLVVCRQLGFQGAKNVTTRGHFKTIMERKIWMDNVECKGDEEHVKDCRFNGWGQHNCDATEAAGVVCKKEKPGTTAAPTDTSLQNDAPVRKALKYKIVGLGGGSENSDDGYLLVDVNGRKGTICADHWTLKEAQVACQQLGKHYASMAYKSNIFGGGDEEKVLAGITCEGHENKLSECFHKQVLDEVECPKKRLVAGVSCTKVLPDLIPDAALIETTTYIQDRPLFYMACAMEEGCASRTAYTIMKTSPNWHLHRRRLLRFSANVFNNGTADFRPAIPKHQWEWHSCHMHYHSMEVFATYDLVDHMGTRVAEGHKASFCLEDSGGCKNGKKRRYSCQHYGDQGISVGCGDLYKHNIDCQWIDVSDVSTGRYTLKVRVNPDNKVPELSYDNNLVTCDLYYQGSYAKATNCKHVKPES